jgi:hypothetical protein
MSTLFLLAVLIFLVHFTLNSAIGFCIKKVLNWYNTMKL